MASWTLSGRRTACRGGALVLAAATMLPGCATVDRFGSRAVTYNQELQQSRRASIILNILRASDDQPLQFSEVTTITGQSSAQGSVSGELPVLGSAAGGPRLFSLLPGVQGSGGPSFTVANLNTQEFFNGITAPIRPEIIASYANVGYSRYTLLPLLISSIEFSRGGVNYVFLNNPAKPQSYAVFIRLLSAMIEAGLTFETVEKLDPIGPVLLDQDLRSAAAIGGLLAPSAEAAVRLKSFEASDPDAYLTEEERRTLLAQGHRSYYRLVRGELASRYCFASGQITLSQAEAGLSPGDSGPVVLPPVMVQDRPLALRFGSDMKCGTRGGAAAESVAVDRTTATSLRFASRSVRSVFEYLGQITRMERAGGSATQFDVALPDRRTYRAFGIDAGKADDRSVDYGGKAYSLTRSFSGDESERTVQLLSELQALNSSAKSFPAPSVIPILTR